MMVWIASYFIKVKMVRTAPIIDIYTSFKLFGKTKRYILVYIVILMLI